MHVLLAPVVRPFVRHPREGRGYGRAKGEIFTFRTSQQLDRLSRSLSVGTAGKREGHCKDFSHSGDDSGLNSGNFVAGVLPSL